MRIYGDYICTECGRTFDSLPMVAEPHYETGTLFYEPPVPDTDCPICKSTDSIEKACSCGECYTWVPESEAVTKNGVKYCTKCRIECILCGAIVKAADSYFDDVEDAYVCLECRKASYDKADINLEMNKLCVAVG